MKLTNTLQLNTQNYPQPQNKISFEAIHIRQMNPDCAQMRTQLERELEYFTKNGDNADLLGAGITSAVYKFKRIKNIVFKKSLKLKDDFREEIEHLRMLPESLRSVQKFIAQAFDDETGLFYLLSTKMPGKIADCKKNPWTREHFKNFFETLFELDKNGIYHGDLHCGNILLDDAGNANLIDFQWTQKLLRSQYFLDKPNSILPAFMMSENSQMFEMAGIPYYIKFMDNSRQGKRFLQDYLKEKAVYHQNRSYFLRTFFERSVGDTEKANIIKGINYEDAQSIILRHPTDDVLRIEIKKLQFLSNFRHACGQADMSNPNMNYVTAPASHLMTLSAIQELRHEIALQKKQKFMSSTKREYLKYTEEYAKYWFDNICSWIGGVFDMSLYNAGTSRYIEHNNRFNNFENLTDIYRFVGEKYRSRYTQEFSLPKSMTETYKGIRKETANILKEYIYLDFDPKVIKKLNEIKNSMKN